MYLLASLNRTELPGHRLVHRSPRRGRIYIGETGAQSVGHHYVADRPEPGVLHRDRPGDRVPHVGLDLRGGLSDPNGTGEDLHRLGVVKGASVEIHPGFEGPGDRIAPSGQRELHRHRVPGREFVGRSEDGIEVPDEVEPGARGLRGYIRPIMERDEPGARDVSEIGVGACDGEHDRARRLGGVSRERERERGLPTPPHLVRPLQV